MLVIGMLTLHSLGFCKITGFPTVATGVLTLAQTVVESEPGIAVHTVVTPSQVS